MGGSDVSGSPEAGHGGRFGRGPFEDNPPPDGPSNLELELPSGVLPLGYVAEGETIYLAAKDRASRWPTWALREGSVSLRISERRVRSPVALITDPVEKSRVLDLFRTRYGEQQFNRWYANAARVLAVTPNDRRPTGRPRDAYHDWLAAEFDNVADDYDRHITGNRINRLLRDRSLAELRRTFEGVHRLLEIGCGSGMETLPLLREGHEILCVDISERMLEVVREKARSEGLSERVETRKLAAAELPRLLDEFGRGAFDGAYSTYGAMNCEADLRPFAPALAELLRGAARFVAGVYNRWCLFELVGYGVTGRWSRAVGRARRPIPVGASRFCVDVYSFSAPEFARLFEPWFTVVRLEGVPVVLPPSDLVHYADRFASGFEDLSRLDARMGARWPFNRLGDHFLMTMARRGEPRGPGGRAR